MKKKFFRNIALCMLICLVLAALASCTTTPPTSDGTEAPSSTSESQETKPVESMVEVVRVVQPMKRGEKITAEKITTELVREAVVPLNALRTTEGIAGKYLTADVVKGDYIFPNKLSSTEIKELDIKEEVSYISVKAFVKAGADNADEIQKLIDSNPGRTLYFADGTYLLSKPLLISADPSKKVSFELSDYAVIKAADSWSSGDAMIRIGAKDAQGALSSGSCIKGGIIDGSGKANGISVEGGRDAVLTNISFKNTATAIVLGAFEGTDARTTVENSCIIGSGAESSVGISLESNANVVEIVEVNNCETGIKLSGRHNLMRNVHAVYSGTAAASRGFDDNGENNSYDYCYAESYAVGFYMGSKVKGSVYTNCYVFWTKDTATQTAFATEGKFLSNIRTCRADFNSSEAKSAYIKVGSEGGSGRVAWPLIKNKANIDDNTYESYLGTTTVTEILK